MSDRLIDIPVDPATLTDRQRAALEIVRAWGQPISALELGTSMYGVFMDGRQKGWALGYLNRLRDLGLVRRVGRGGGRWALSEGDRDPSTPGGEALNREQAQVRDALPVAPSRSSDPSPSLSGPGDFPEGF